MGSLYWFIMGNNIVNQSSDATSGLKDEPESVAMPEVKMSLAEALVDLKNEGCRIVTIKSELFMESPEYFGYNEFRIKALETKTVVVSPSESGYFLVVTKGDIQWVWIPS